MKKLIVLAAALATTLFATTPASARDHGYGYGRHAHRHGGYGGVRYYAAPRVYCPPPRVYYAPRYCAPRPVCPPRYYGYGYGYGYGYARPSVHLSFGYSGYRGARW